MDKDGLAYQKCYYDSVKRISELEAELAQEKKRHEETYLMYAKRCDEEMARGMEAEIKLRKAQEVIREIVDRVEAMDLTSVERTMWKVEYAIWKVRKIAKAALSDAPECETCGDTKFIAVDTGVPGWDAVQKECPACAEDKSPRGQRIGNYRHCSHCGLPLVGPRKNGCNCLAHNQLKLSSDKPCPNPDCNEGTVLDPDPEARTVYECDECGGTGRVKA